MNIFLLDRNPVLAAKYLCDKHVPKMVLESAQMLCTAHRVCDGGLYEVAEGKSQWVHENCVMDLKLYKATHVNHPCNAWTRASRSNYEFHLSLWYQLCLEYEHRFDKKHACYEKMWLYVSKTPNNIPDTGFTPIPQAMPAAYKRDDPVEAYRAYYIGEKARFAKWDRGRPAPDWWPYEAA